MGLNIITVKSSNLIQDYDLRIDNKFHYFLEKNNWSIFNSSKTEIRLKDILIPTYVNFNFDEDLSYNGIPTGQTYIDEDGFIIDSQIVTKEEHPNRIKYKITNENILISSLRLAKSPALLFEDLNVEKYVFSNGFYIFDVIDGKWNKKYLLYILRNNKLKTILDNSIYRGIGISAYKEKDFLKLKIPLIDKSVQDTIVRQIVPIENTIKKLKQEVEDFNTIISNYFKIYFSFDYNSFENLKKNKIFTKSLIDYSNNRDLRNSVKFHREAYKFVLNELKNVTTKKVKDYISEPIVLGSGISPKDYNEEGEFEYISMANIKNWYYDKTDVKTVSEEYSRNNLKSVKNNDIIIARSGEGTIGKVAIIEEDEKAIFCDFTMRIRLKNYNPLFAYYYFRSVYFQYMIEINKKGLGNNTNIFPSQIQEFPMPDISLDEQNKIVSEIKTELDKQNLIKDKIKLERGKIDNLIESVIKN